ncbi:hypothetical protein Tco_0276062 [Tanacetum coccineum]
MKITCAVRGSGEVLWLEIPVDQLLSGLAKSKEKEEKRQGLPKKPPLALFLLIHHQRSLELQELWRFWSFTHYLLLLTPSNNQGDLKMEEAINFLTDQVDDAILSTMLAKHYAGCDLLPCQLRLEGCLVSESVRQMVPDQMWIEEECKYDVAAMYGSPICAKLFSNIDAHIEGGSEWFIDGIGGVT